MRDGNIPLVTKSEKYSASLIHTAPSYKLSSERLEFAPEIRCATKSPAGEAPQELFATAAVFDELELVAVSDFFCSQPINAIIAKLDAARKVSEKFIIFM